MRVLILLTLVAMLSACMGVSVTNPPVTVDTTKLQELPPGAGYVILQQQAKGLKQMYVDLGQKGMNVNDAINAICQYDPNRNKVIVPSGEYDPAQLEMWAFQVHLDGHMGAVAQDKGWPLARTEIMIGKAGQRQVEDICGVTTIVEDNLTAQEVQQRLVRIFSAGRQLGMGLSCGNVDC